MFLFYFRSSRTLYLVLVVSHPLYHNMVRAPVAAITKAFQLQGPTVDSHNDCGK